MISGTTIELQELIDLRSQVRFNKRRSITASISGSKLTKIKGRGVDLDEVRLYHTGDDVRNIDWKVTARKNKPHTKIFREEQERPTLIVVDETKSMFFGSQIRFKSIAAAEISALIAWQALEANDRVGAIVVNDGHLSITKPRRSGVTVTHCLSEIAQGANGLHTQIASRQVNPNPWSFVPESINNLARSNYRIVIISDMVSLSELILLKLLQLSRRNRVEIVLVYDNLERTLPPANKYIVEDLEERVSFDTGDQKLRDSYRKRFEKKVSDLVDKCRSHRVEFTKVTTDMSITQLLF